MCDALPRSANLVLTMKRKKVMTILWSILGVLVALALVLFVGGSLIAREHKATCTIELQATPDAAFQAISDWKNLPSWNKSVTAVAELPGGGVWVETMGSMKIPLRIEKSEAPRLFVARIADEELPFGGTWTHTLEATGQGTTRLTTTEDGFIKSAPFRFIAHFVLGYHTTLSDYQTALGARFGAKASPTKS